MLSRGIYGVFFWHLSDLEEMIVGGTFDAYLIRPVSPFLQFIGKDISYTGVGDFLVGVLGFILAAAQIGIHWNMGQWAYFLICVLSGALIQVAINLIGASLCFWTTRSNAAMNIAERFTVLMQQYPVNIFGKYFQIFVTCFLPVAFINYYPALLLLGKGNSVIDYVLGGLSPFVGVGVFAFSIVFFYKGLQVYCSPGN